VVDGFCAVAFCWVIFHRLIVVLYELVVRVHGLYDVMLVSVGSG